MLPAEYLEIHAEEEEGKSINVQFNDLLLA